MVREVITAVLFLAVLGHQGQVALAVTVSTGVNFQLPVVRTDLFDQYTLDPADPIILRPSLVSKPSLPGWLKFVQPLDSSDGYLYGTPPDSKVGLVDLEILALNSKTYESSRRLLSLTVEENTDSPEYLATFFITNQNLADLLNPETQEDFLAAVSSIWGQGSNFIIQSLTSASDLGLQVPLNPGPDEKFGVQVVIGAQMESTNLSAVIDDATSPCEQGMDYTPQELNEAFQPTFAIDWCKFALTQASDTQSPSMNKTSSAVPLGGMYNPPVMVVEDSDRFLEFLLLIVVPCAVALCFILLLGYLMCCGRRSRKEQEFASDMQLSHHRMLRAATRDLRTMSNRRDGTASVATLTPLGTPTVGGQRPHNRSRGYDDYSWASTPKLSHRGMATPPPYRTPPHPHKHRETSFSNQNADKRRLSEPSNARGESPAMTRPVPPFMGSSTSDRGGVRPRLV